jgi:hypothetical protein
MVNYYLIFALAIAAVRLKGSQRHTWQGSQGVL